MSPVGKSAKFQSQNEDADPRSLGPGHDLYSKELPTTDSPAPRNVTWEQLVARAAFCQRFCVTSSGGPLVN